MREKGGQVREGWRHRECWLRQNSVMIFSSEIVPPAAWASRTGAEARASSELDAIADGGGSFQVTLPPDVAEGGSGGVAEMDTPPTARPDCASELMCGGVCCTPAAREAAAAVLRRITDCREGCCADKGEDVDCCTTPC